MSYEQPQAYIVENVEYNDKFNIPVLTAGQTFILGYTNEKKGIKYASKKNPIIIFDDFTTSSHYVDFPFKIKSSAMKLLKLYNDDDNLNFAFLILKKIKYNPINHERHWISKFSDFTILVPKLKEEQDKIGTLLHSLDNLITLHQRKYDKTKKISFKNSSNIFKTILRKVAVPWEQRKLRDVATRVQGNDGRMNLPTLTISASNGWMDQRDRFSGNIAGVEQKNYTLLHRGELSYNHGNSKLAKYGVVFSLQTYEEALVPRVYHSFKIDKGKASFIEYYFATKIPDRELGKLISSGARIDGLLNIGIDEFMGIKMLLPSVDEQIRIAEYFRWIDNLITLHQRKVEKLKNVKKLMLEKEKWYKMNNSDGNEIFYKYYEKWIEVYKKGAIRNSTMQKYRLTLKWLKNIAPNLKTEDINRISYQEILNKYAENHERQSTMDFHHQLKASILDAVDEGLISRDPTRKAIIKGKTPRSKKEKYLNQFELQKLISDLNLSNEISYDWLIYLIAKTGLRFSEALAVTPNDFDFPHQTLNIEKTWNYKENGGFEPTKNKSSERKVQLDWQTVIQFSELIKNMEANKPIFINTKIYNSTINDILKRHCLNVEIPVITIHGLRHTHASILLYAGVSIASVAHRLGHASMSTTQKTYLHIIQELENTDIDKIMRALTSLNN